jgi:uncharacterized protein with FMN-binding domain
VSIRSFKGGTVSVTVDASGSSTAKHTWTLTASGRKAASESYKDAGGAKTWTFKNMHAGSLKVTAPASKGQITKVTLTTK